MLDLLRTEGYRIAFAERSWRLIHQAYRRSHSRISARGARAPADLVRRGTARVLVGLVKERTPTAKKSKTIVGRRLIQNCVTRFK
jgi:hypothetical protein